MNKPNIFSYATSELSQDAVICYILEWAKIENKELNNDLHNLAINFLNSLFDKFEGIKRPTEYEKIEIKKQYENIDILCIINDKYSIIIEDKTNTKNHSDQLKRYFEKVKANFSDTEILPIYFKTGDQSNYEDVDKKYKIYLRKDFLNILTSLKYKNDIIENYTDYLQNIEDSINSYKLTPIDNWSWNAWKGFYIELKEKLGEGNWDYVSNRQGGFLGFWWNWDTKDSLKYHIYLQIETSWEKNKYVGQIKIKLYTKTNNKIEKSIINKWKTHIISNENNIFIKKPKVVRTGKSVTIGFLENEFRITNENDIVDMNKTIEFIRKIEKLKIDKFESLES
ncbi:MAG: PD-(D/E)XK nuclease family protein [Candidatus Gracilibacteria bacterium]